MEEVTVTVSLGDEMSYRLSTSSEMLDDGDEEKLLKAVRVMVRACAKVRAKDDEERRRLTRAGQRD